MLHAFYLCLWYLYVWFFICFIKLWRHQVWDIEVFVPSHTSTYNRTLCKHSHRETVAPSIGNFGEASSQLSWGVNLRMGSQNTSIQIEPFPFVACNGWGSRYPTSLAWTTVGNNLGAFRVIQSRNKCSNPKPTLDRAIPFREKYLELGHIKGHLYFFLKVGNKTDTHLLWFF